LAERALLRGLGGGCLVPVGVLSRVEGDRLWLRGAVLTPDGEKRIVAEHNGAAADAQSAGQQLAEVLVASGARELLITPG
jgi:hydroxymethylbilane synthase